MINWWILPLICTLLLAGLLHWVFSDKTLPYREFIAVAVAIICGPVVAIMWLLCFTLTYMTP